MNDVVTTLRSDGEAFRNEWLKLRGEYGEVHSLMAQNAPELLGKLPNEPLQTPTHAHEDDAAAKMAQGVKEALGLLLARLAEARNEPAERNQGMPAVDDEDLAILRAMAKRYPLLLTHAHIEGASASPRVSRQTVAQRMPRLIQEGLAGRPKGPKQGATITAAGREVLAAIEASRAT